MKQLTYNVDYNSAFKRNNNTVLDKKPLFTNAFSQNGKNVKYYSGIDAEIYFEDIYIDETVQIQFSVQQNVMPLTGYNSFVYDDIALGARIVQGQFAINFTRAEYLIEILNTLERKRSINNVEIISEAEYTYQEKMDKNKVKANMTDETLDPIMQWRKSPLWNKGFNIIFNYGGFLNGQQGGTLVVLDGVYITGCSQGVAASGEPVTEIYSFIARDIQFVPKSITEQKPQKQADEETSAVTNGGISIKYTTYSEEATKISKTIEELEDTDQRLVQRYNKLSQEVFDDIFYNNDVMPHLKTKFDFGDVTPLAISAYLDIPVSTSSRARSTFDLNLSALKDGEIDTILSKDIMDDMHAYQRVDLGNASKRQFNVFYTIVYKDKNDKQATAKISNIAVVNNIEA